MTRTGMLAGALAISLVGATQAHWPAELQPLAGQQTAAQQTTVQQTDEQRQHARLVQTMKVHQQMMADMKAADEKLNALVARIDSAKGNARVDAIAETLTLLVEQRAKMHEHMGQLGCRMMGHMMQHSATGRVDEMHKQMMADCAAMSSGGTGGTEQR